jgi:cytochrome P450
MTHVAGDIIYRTLFSETLAPDAAATIHRAFARYQRHAQSSATLRIYGLPSFGFRASAVRAARSIHAVFEPIVRARYDAHGRDEDHVDKRAPDILDSLLNARHPDTGEPFTYAQLLEQVSTIFLAGHETSASAMTWALYILASCPDLQDAVREEVRAVGGCARLTPDGLKQLHRTRNVFRETLRLYPPVSFFVREVTAPTCMRDKQLDPGAMLIVSPWLIQRNREHWPDPHAFDADRFDRPDARQACRHAYMPFGKGPRTCVGAGFAMQEATLILAWIVDRFHLEAIPDKVPEPVSRLTLRPKHGVWLRLQPLQAED